MPDDAASLLARLVRPDGDFDVAGLLDAVLLASAWSRAGVRGPGDASSALPTDDGEQRTQADRSPAGQARAADARTATTGPSDGSAAPVWLEDHDGAQGVSGKRATIGRAAPLPHALEIGRALRPFRRPWLAGVRERLDIDATVEYFTRTGVLVPRLTPAPEPWLEAVVVLDQGTAMAVWDEPVRSLTRTLRALAAFRDVNVWTIDHSPGETPLVRDHQGHVVVMDPDRAHHTQPARRLLLVVTDCAARAWRDDAIWRTLHVWGRTAPVALINPLPQRLWQHSGLDLPRTTASATTPAACGQHLSYRPPRLLRMPAGTTPWQALPVLQFDAAQILAWARTLMRTDPAGCAAVLVPATGRPPRRQHTASPGHHEEVPAVAEQIRARTVAFLDDQKSQAARLAMAAAPLDNFTLPLLDVLRERLVPEAGLADVAEFLTAGLLTASRTEAGEPVYRFHPAAVGHLKEVLTRDSLWDTHFALSDHLEAHFQAPHGISVILESTPDADILPTGLRPIAHAAAGTARLLGIEATNSLLDFQQVTTPTDPSVPDGDLPDPAPDEAEVDQAQRTVEVLLVDDLDGSPADETVTFGLDGLSYEIDLTTENADKLRGLLEPYVKAGRRVRGPRATGDVSQDIARIRAWAKENGLDVSDHGRLPASVRYAYDEANP